MNSQTSDLEQYPKAVGEIPTSPEPLSDQLRDGLKHESRIFENPLVFLAVITLILLISNNPDWIKAQANDIYQLLATSDFARAMSQYLAR